MIPRATYRLQFSRDFTFADAAALVPYLAGLGVSHLYASPWLKARTGSTHGYDIVDHNAFNPELGGEAGFEALHAALKAHGLGQILDFVPNHMGVARADNAWWLDVLEWGRASPYAEWFDIDWTPADPDLRNKVLLPFLGDHYGAVLERGELEPRFDPATGSFSVWYFEHRFPLSPHSYAYLLRAAAQADATIADRLEALAVDAERLRARAGTTARASANVRDRAARLKARLASDASLHAPLQDVARALCATPGDAASVRPLHRLLERQAYRLAYWRMAADEINYRRFFDINELAALRVEYPPVFAHIHTLVARLLDTGKLDGLRIDHIDGLFDPARYCRRVRQLSRRPFYLVVEKILARHERLRTNWPVEGTTGYDFLGLVTGLLIDPRQEAVMTRAYRHFLGHASDFGEILHAAKRQIVHSRLSGELHVLARQLHRIARRHPRTRDYTLQALTRALADVVAAFPVYRTYVDTHGATAADRRDITWAVAQARKRWDLPDVDIFEFIEAALTTRVAETPGYRRLPVLRFAQKFQQYTSPVMAKGFEDTALYRHHRMDALNEVGSDPRQFGVDVTDFHRANQERARLWPHAMLATATHDTKRGEDVRARLAALSRVAAEWDRAVRHWARLNGIWKQAANGQRAPERNDEYLLYQTLIGAWPVALMDGAWDEAIAARFVARVQAYMTKALREAKQHSSWANPDSAYEAATRAFIAQILDREHGRLFLEAFLPLQARVAELGVDNSLVQVALKLTCPGVPDVYQGAELWDLNLVDPDNRRAVDFARRAERLAQAEVWDTLSPERQVAQLATWRAAWHDGLVKLHVLRRLLGVRAQYPDVFLHGDYRPVTLAGDVGERVIAFERRHEGARIMVAAILHGDATVAGAGAPGGALSAALPVPCVDVLSGRRYAADPDPLAFAPLPVAVLLHDDAGGA